MSKPQLVHVAAMTVDGVLGFEGSMPWHHPEDLAHFRKTTLHGTVVMGRKTFESLGSKPLPNRENIVLSRSGEVKPFELGKSIFIIGGGELYASTIDETDYLILTMIKGTYQGDTYYPIHKLCDFDEVDVTYPPTDPNISFHYYRRKGTY